jgi:hypothetical protein
MPKKQHSEKQIIGALKQYEAGAMTGGDSAASWGSARLPFICGSGSMPVWVCRSYTSFANCARRTVD